MIRVLKKTAECGFFIDGKVCGEEKRNVKWNSSKFNGGTRTG